MSNIQISFPNIYIILDHAYEMETSPLKIPSKNLQVSQICQPLLFLAEHWFLSFLLGAFGVFHGVALCLR